jgi:hypothetical protein
VSLTREITLRPALLAYQDTIVIQGVTLTLDIEYRVRDDDWWLTLIGADGLPIASGLRVTTGRPLPAGVFDPRLPQGGRFVAVRLEDGNFDDPRAGELGTAVRLLWVSLEDVQADIAEAGQATDWIAPARIKSIQAV